MCSHPYLKKLSPDADVCLECGAIVKKKDVKHLKDSEALIMPPVIYIIDKALWEQIRPWPLMPFEIVKKYGWYISFIYGRQYLVMPVFKKGKGPVFYSARCLEKDCPKKYKYLTPEGRNRVMWQSGGKGKYALVGEGIADAAYLSQLAPSRAYLGSSGSAVENDILVLDGDAKGIEAAFTIVQEARLRGVVSIKLVTLPAGKDPTDLPLPQLCKLIYEQTGVKL